MGRAAFDDIYRDKNGTEPQFEERQNSNVATTGVKIKFSKFLQDKKKIPLNMKISIAQALVGLVIVALILPTNSWPMGSKACSCELDHDGGFCKLRSYDSSVRGPHRRAHRCYCKATWQWSYYIEDGLYERRIFDCELVEF